MSSPSAAIVQQYLDHHYRIVTWPAIGDAKGPHGPAGAKWTEKTYGLADYHEGYRVGLVTGIEVEPGKFLHDVDIDWSPGSNIAMNFLPATNFVFGRPGKKVSHCFYTLAQALPSYTFADIDKTTLIELRGAKADGSIGFQTMAPPSVWTKNGASEPLQFVKNGQPSHLDPPAFLKQRTTLAAIAMLLAKHLGVNGFGHDPRLAWAGYLLRAGLSVEDLVVMGQALSLYCNNKEVSDVRRVVESTAAALAAENKKVKGGPTLARILGVHGRQIIARINDWLGRESDFVRDANGVVIKDHQENIKHGVAMLGHELFYNEFADKMLIDKVQPLEDRQLNSLWLHLDSEFRFRPSFAFFEKVVKEMAWEAPFHPVKDYLATLRWDGLPRIDHWLHLLAGADDSEYLQAVGSIMLVAAVRRVRQPGCKYDELLVLEGGQGFGKSSALRALCPNNEWFSDDLQLNLNSQRIIEATVGKWIIEAADLAGKRKTEIEQLKAMLSRSADGPARMAYAHLPVERARQFIIVGTTNSAAYLTDPTGARRFWPVKTSRFDIEAVTTLRDQLWAEASAREQQGYSIRLPERLWPAAQVEQEERREIDAWEGPIRALLLGIERNTDGRRRVTTGNIWDVLGVEVIRRDRYGSTRISEIMQRLGYRRTRIRLPGLPVEVGFAEIVPGAEIELREEDAQGQPADDETPF